MLIREKIYNNNNKCDEQYCSNYDGYLFVTLIVWLHLLIGVNCIILQYNIIKLFLKRLKYKYNSNKYNALIYSYRSNWVIDSVLIDCI